VAIQLTAALLTRKRPREKDRRESRKHLDLIVQAAETMKRLMEDLLDATTLEAGSLQLDPSREQAAPLLEECLELFEPIAARKSVHLRREIPRHLPPVRCDRGRMTQVLSNLVGNAVKFAPEGGVVSVRARRGADHLQLTVADDGPGIAEDQLPHLFDRYWKGTRKREGAGLGLYIAKGIVEAHGGRIWVESRLGAGTRFHLTIPFADVKDRARSA
jgi:signal transduction histidine kinase